MKAKILLADFAEADSSGKVHALGLGWTLIGVPTGPMAIITFLQLERHEMTTEDHELVLTLVDKNDDPVFVGEEESRVKLEFSATAKIVERPGMEQLENPLLTGVVVVGLSPGLPLEPATAYSWVASVGGETDPSWRAEFLTQGAS